MSTSYNFSYKDRYGLLSPVTIDEWATMTLTETELANYNTAKTFKDQFTFDQSTFFVIKDFPYSSAQQAKPIVVTPEADFSDIDHSIIYKTYNFVSFLVNASINDATSRFSIDASAIPEDQLAGYKETLTAWIMMFIMRWSRYESDVRPVTNLSELVLRFNGTNAVELGLDKLFPILATTTLPFPDLNWEQWWDRFLADPSIVINSN